MVTRREELRQALKETLDGGPRAFAAIETGAKTGRGVRGGDIPVGAHRWLTTPHTLLLFRTSDSAERASELTAEHRYQAIVFQRYLLLEAPWLFVAALVASLDIGAEVLAIHWEGPPRQPRLRSAMGPEWWTKARSLLA
jgi:hypothetical protein